MVGFDHRRLTAKTTLHYIRVNGSLYQEVNGTDFLRLFLKDTDKFLANDLSLMLWLLNTF